MHFCASVATMLGVRCLIIIALVCCVSVLRTSVSAKSLRGSTASIIEQNDATILQITGTNGVTLNCELQPTEVLSLELAMRFPQIQTWKGFCVEDPNINVRCDRSPFGLQVQLFTLEETLYIDQPNASNPAASRRSSSELRTFAEEFTCLTETASISIEPDPVKTNRNHFHQMKTFRLAIAAAGEYTEFHGGTVESALAAIVTVFNRVNGIYERELGIRLLLVPGTEQLIFTNQNTDPFTNNYASLETIHTAQSTFDQILGSNNYDVGILFNTGTYGLAYLASVCHPQRKGSACMGLPEPVGEFFMTYVAHEMAHQFGANHTFNTSQGPCGSARFAPTAVEPGTGSTLLSYAGLPCANDSLQPLMSDYLHADSLREIRAFLSGIQCAQVITTSNHPPLVTVATEFVVPKETPFTLVANGNDPDGDLLFYTWEQLDLGPAKSLSDPDNGLSPLFRSFPPHTNAARTFPRWDALLQNVSSHGEQLPETNRLMHFRVTVRDSRNMGAMGLADTHVQVIHTNGPFKITSHNNSGTFGGAQLITWDVSGTTNLPIHATMVNLLLSTNGGQTFSIPLATNSPNDGAELVTLPDISCDNARLKIQPVGHIFFDINDTNFNIGTPPIFSSAEPMGTNLMLRWTFQSGKQYKLEHADTLPSLAWEEVAVSTATNGHELEAVVPMQSLGNRFFRIREFNP